MLTLPEDSNIGCAMPNPIHGDHLRPLRPFPLTVRRRGRRRHLSSLLGHRRGQFTHDIPFGVGLLERVSRGLICAREAELRRRTVLGAYMSLMRPSSDS